MPERQPAITPAYDMSRRGAGSPVSLEEIAHAGKLSLRGDPADRAFLSAIGSVLDLVLPTEPNTVTTEHGVTALWAGPDEWVLIMPSDDAGVVADRLYAAVTGIGAALVDITDAFTTIRLRGARARDVIAKGCPLDLHPRVFRTGQVAQSILAGIPVTLHQVVEDGDDAGPAFDLHVPRSFAAHLWSWLTDAAAEFAAEADRATGPLNAVGR